MPTPSTPPHRAPGASVKEDLGVMLAVGDDTLAHVAKMSVDLQLAIEHLTKLLSEAHSLKTNDAGVMSELTLLRDQVDTFSSDVATFQAAVENHDGVIQEVSSQEINVLASVVATLLDVNDSLESLKASVVGLNTFTKDHPCPWASDSVGLTALERIHALTEIARLLPTLQVVLSKAADREGFVTKDDGTDPHRKYWARRYLDQFRDAIVAMVFSTLAGGAVSFAAWTYYFGAQSTVEKARSNARQETYNQLVQAEEAKHRLESRLRALEGENATLRAKRRLPAEPKP